ncbi:MAG: nucleotide pyrophosphohydrolase [Acholeplasmatales bacterium]|nr:nucleotide pyrophosphohydrolase [Acholeplasmataceae bacterium]MDY0115112.1 nucleotide pyrophosphohydrolase [Acholeplasmatales bacterium]MCK9233810.1 nucleotide pyrophosphohydrolase [Acholeplasmataceae bacterium]MCK9289301.1 nucleotide pyrophosphohydrolase [Acholeplasmataceae bacterium]MCK9427205.1 nucleotide pyrophosphohydrolase [Acholeplasmataceae bacterium]
MKEIINEIINFRDKRAWKQFHTPANLAKSISIEAAELLENFQWQEKEVSLLNVEEELADILIYAFTLADYYNFDIKTIMLGKIAKNKQKYPEKEVYGSAEKYQQRKKK